MPEIVFDRVVSFSSEDPKFPADNLLKPDSYRKWKCAKEGELQATVVLQLQSAVCIHSVDIGNEGSSFIEVLVNRSSKPDSDWKVLLIASSFMSPGDSKSGQNMNRVRMFTSDKLNPSTATEKWDRIKVVCSQPFSKTIKYGLSFIKIHSPPDKTETESVSTKLNLGRFTLKDESHDPPQTARAGLLFMQKKEQNLIKAPAELSKPINSPTTSQPVNGSSSPPVSSAKKRSFLADPASNKKARHYTDPANELPPSKTPISSDKKNSVSTTSQISTAITPPKSTASVATISANTSKLAAISTTPKSANSKPKVVIFNDILKGVVFVISGIQNPVRSDLRDKAIAMGAKYKPDWEGSCTHLICAFTNTPKYVQVAKAGGKIVKKDWILDCHSKKYRISWKKYKLLHGGDTSSETEDEVAPVSISLIDSDSDSGSDVFDSKPKPNSSGVSIYDVDTDVSDDEMQDGGPSQKKGSKPDTSALPLPDLLEIFKKKTFYIHADISLVEKRSIERSVVAFGGAVADQLTEDVNFVLSNGDWDDGFDDALEVNENLAFVKPKWVQICTEKGRLVPYQAFVITKSF